MTATTAFGPQGPNYATTRPPADPKASAGIDTWFKNCSAAGAKDGTFATADFFNVIVGNLRYLVRTSGVPLDDLDDTMVYQAVAHIFSQLMSSQGFYGVDTGTINNAVVNVPAVTALTEGQFVLVKMKFANTAAATLNVSGMGAKPILKLAASALTGGEYYGNQICMFVYNGVANGWQLMGAAARPTLAQNTNIYVDAAAGSDTLYDGTAATISGGAGPFKTIQKAVSTAFGYAPSQFTIGIYVANGVYNENVATPQYSGPNITIIGAGTAGVVVNGGAGHCFNINGPNTASIQNLTVQNDNVYPHAGFLATNGAVVSTSNTASNNCSIVFESAGAANMSVGNHSFGGNSYAMYYTIFGGRISLTGTHTISASITVSFADAVASGAGYIDVDPSLHYVNPGSVTGARFNVAVNGVIAFPGSNDGTSGTKTFFPGTVSGSQLTGGQYAG